MNEQIIEFIKEYVEMRNAQKMHGKSGYSFQLAKAMQLQLNLDNAAPILLEILTDTPKTKP